MAGNDARQDADEVLSPIALRLLRHLDWLKERSLFFALERYREFAREPSLRHDWAAEQPGLKVYVFTQALSVVPFVVLGLMYAAWGPGHNWLLFVIGGVLAVEKAIAVHEHLAAVSVIRDTETARTQLARLIAGLVSTDEVHGRIPFPANPILIRHPGSSFEETATFVIYNLDWFTRLPSFCFRWIWLVMAAGLTISVGIVAWMIGERNYVDYAVPFGMSLVLCLEPISIDAWRRYLFVGAVTSEAEQRFVADSINDPSNPP